MSLLDTPKKISLQSQANTLRIALKDYERAFGIEHNGRKPTRDEIKADKVAAARYKQYQTVQDVLAGKRSIAALSSSPTRSQQQRPTVKRKHDRTDSAIGLTPQGEKGTLYTSSPARTRAQLVDIDPYDPPSTVSPRVLPNAIGPTPRRDGMVLGIFDMLSASDSGTSSQMSPSSKKRKIDVLLNATELQAQTPSRMRKHSPETRRMLPPTTPSSKLGTGKRNHLKTPVSSSKKFMLNHFFATPSAVRFAGVLKSSGSQENVPPRSQTPLRDLVLGITPVKQPQAGEAKSETAVDATPPYLKRSFSFKERLLSASSEDPTASTKGTKAIRRSLSGNLRSSKFQPKSLSQIIADREQAQSELHAAQQTSRQPQPPQRDIDEDDEDDLDALRDLEANEVNTLVEDSQLRRDAHSPPREPEQPTRIYKKKGQKRTTRRSNMRPTKMKPVAAQNFVGIADDEDSASEHSSNHEGEVEIQESNTSRVEETQFPDDEENDYDFDGTPSSPDIEYLDDEEYAQPQRPTTTLDAESEDELSPPPKSPGATKSQPSKSSAPSKPTPKSRASMSSSSGRKKSSPDGISKPASSTKKSTRTTSAKTRRDNDKSEAKAGRTIDPNALSHQNFRSLKIKNKNSKAKKGGGRFGRGRR